MRKAEKKPVRKIDSDESESEVEGDFQLNLYLSFRSLLSMSLQIV